MRPTSVRDFLKRYLIFVQGVVALAALGVGVEQGPITDVGTILVGLGVAFLASFLLALISISRDDLLESLFRQGVVEAFPSRAGMPDEYWDALLKDARRHYRVLGVANHGYISTEAKKLRYAALIKAAIDRKVDVEFIWLSPDCPAGKIRDLEEGRGTRKDTVNAIIWFWSLREGLEKTAQPRLSLKEHKLIPSCGITHADDSLTVAHYVPGQDNWDSPGWILTETQYPFFRRFLAYFGAGPQNELVKVYLDTYTEVTEVATEITGARVEALKKKLTNYVGPSEADLKPERVEKKNT